MSQTKQEELREFLIGVLNDDDTSLLLQRTHTNSKPNSLEQQGK